MTPAACLRVYNEISSRTGSAFRYMSKPLRYELRVFLAWCEKEEVDPELWIRARHEVVKYRSRVPVKSLVSDSFLEHYREWAGGNAAAERKSEETIDFWEPTGGITMLGEQLKRAYVLDRELCAGLKHEHGGYNKESEFCGSCPFSEECRNGAF